MSASDELDALRQAVVEAERRVKEVDGAEKGAKEQLREARAGLAEAEQDDATGKGVAEARRRLERARVAVEHEPWAERRQLAQRRVGGAQRAVREFVREHIVELVEEKEAAAEAAAATRLAGAEMLIVGDRELHQRVSEIAALWKMVATPRQGDIEYIRAERLVSEASALIERGADGSPRLSRERMAQALQAEGAVPA